MPTPRTLRVFAALCAMLGACGTSRPAIRAVTVSLSPTSVSIKVNQTAQFTATVANATNAAVIWSLTEGGSGGSVSSAGLYTAPANAGTYHVAATAAADATASASVEVTVIPVLSISVSPAASFVKVGQTAQFTATVSTASNTAVNWKVSEGASGGSVSPTGLYTAPATVGNYHLIATIAADPATSATAEVVVRANTPAVGVWTPVTPANVSLTGSFSCGNYGTQTVAVDPIRPSDVYAMFHCQGIWKSTDFGYTWTGPINTGTGGPDMAGAGGIVIPSASTTTPPLMYAANIRDPGIGFWRSTDGGVGWTRFNVAPSGARQDYYPPAVDPYDANHLLMAGHEMNVLVQSSDGGQSWTAVHTEPGMQQSGGTAFATFIDMGSAATTRNTFLWIAQQAGGNIGTWRTADGGTSWARVDKNEHPHGSSQLYQPGSGVVYMAGAYSDLGWGALRSNDYGQHWTHVGAVRNLTNVAGTPSKVYSMFGWAIGAGQTVDPSLEVAQQQGTGVWTSPGTPSTMSQGPAAIATTFDGTHSVILTANYNAGLWFYTEP